MSTTVKLHTDHQRNLLELLRENGVALSAPCGGLGTCGKCVVRLNDEDVLACQTFVSKDCTVEVPETEETVVLTRGISLGDVPLLDPVASGDLLAVDIGTTTVAAFLLDGKTGTQLATASLLNPQSSYGADVISRIQAAVDGSLAELQRLITDGVDALVETLCEKAGRSPADIGVVSIVGNPAMQQLFLGVDPKNLASVPFDPVLTETKLVAAKDYLPACGNATLLVVPDIAGYVGADTVGAVLATKLDSADDNVLLVDIGTNGEMVLRANGRMAACSTAAGPALEGAKITFGMRGAPGAIDKVWLEDGELRSHVIGDTEATGICGSGLIDAVASFLDLGLINKRGRIQSTKETNGQRVLYLNNDIYLTQNDIHEVMLAKGAIAAGVELLAKTLGITVSDIDRVLLAGAFGSFLNADNACRIGLLPAGLEGKATAVGNAAGVGACRMALSRAEFERTAELLKHIQFVELANLPDFMTVFARRMGFTEREVD